MTNSILNLHYDFHKAIQYCNVHHVADDTNLDKLVNHDMKQLNNWVSANKFLLNVENTELINFQGKYYLLKSKLNLLKKSYIHQNE